MRKLLTGLVLALRCLVLPAQTAPDAITPCAPDSTQIENAIVDAVLMIESGAVLDAAHLLDSLSRACPSNDAVLYYQGLCRYSVGEYAGAADVMAKAVELDPSNSWYKETLAGLYLNTGKVREAVELYRELKIDKPSKFPDLFTNSLAADAYRLKRDYPSFFKALTSLVQDENADDEMKYKSLMSSLGGFDRRTFNSLLPQLDTLMLRYCEAEPSSVHAHSLRMEIAINRDDGETVIDECRRLIELHPDSPSEQLTYLSIIGDTYHEQGLESKAFKTYEQALKIDPEYCPVLNNYAYYLSQKKCRLRKAERMSRITIEKEPDNATYLDTYGWILFLRGKAKEAKPYFKHAMIYGGKDSAVILLHFSEVLARLGETDLSTYYRNLAESKKQ